MSATTLHYIFDPLCGWCYAAAPLVRAVQDQLGKHLTLQFHPGILFDSPKTLEQDWRSHILEADARIGQLAGVLFGDAYRARLLSPAPIVLHSPLPAAAVMAAPEAQRLDMLEAIQHAHYVAGQDVCQEAKLDALAQEIGFALAFTQAQASLPQHVDTARKLLHAAGGRGFPTFVLEHEGRRRRIDHAPYYGHPESFVQHLASLLQGEPT